MQDCSQMNLPGSLSSLASQVKVKVGIRSMPIGNNVLSNATLLSNAIFYVNSCSHKQSSVELKIKFSLLIILIVLECESSKICYHCLLFYTLMAAGNLNNLDPSLNEIPSHSSTVRVSADCKHSTRKARSQIQSASLHTDSENCDPCTRYSTSVHLILILNNE